MKLSRTLLILTVILVVTLLAAACTFVVQPPAEEPAAAPMEEASDWVAPEDALISIPVAEAPTLDGMADDAFWADASGDCRYGGRWRQHGFVGSLPCKSVYGGDMVYFLVSWADPTESFVRSPWVKQDDGSWAKLKDPDDKGGDNNVYYEDKMAMIWNIGESIPRFSGMGCYTACHDGENPDAKPYGNKYTDEGMGDIWHWKSVRNLGQIDDQYLDSTQYSPDTPEAGRHGDPKDGGGYVNNESEDKSMPMWMGPEGYPR